MKLLGAEVASRKILTLRGASLSMAEGLQRDSQMGHPFCVERGRGEGEGERAAGRGRQGRSRPGTLSCATNAMDVERCL